MANLNILVIHANFQSITTWGRSYPLFLERGDGFPERYLTSQAKIAIDCTGNRIRKG
jgi:hypothetical protein